MFRKLAMISVLAATAALAGCATYGQQAYNDGRGDYYYGYPSGGSSVSVSVGSGGYYYGGSPYGGYYGGYPYGGYYPYASSYYGYPYSRYYGGYPYYGRPYYPRPRPNGNGNVDRGPQQKPGWRDLDGIRDRNTPRPDTRAQTYQRPTQVYQQRPAPVRAETRPARVESRQQSRGAYSGVIQRATETKRRQPIEP